MLAMSIGTLLEIIGVSGITGVIIGAAHKKIIKGTKKGIKWLNDKVNKD